MEYHLGPNKDYLLRDTALHHILYGEITDRQQRENGKTTLSKILSGGLHTLAAWENFLTLRPDIKHGLFFDDSRNEDWYFLRKLKNEVMVLKIPKSAFQSNAAKLTRFAENYRVSGYLWKTLFPSFYEEADILKAIDEALENQDSEETKAAYIIGYTKSTDPFKVLKIRIQLRGKEILSAFPVWGQPMTGNEGKPFSPTEALKLIVAESTVFMQQDKIRIENLALSYNWQAFEELKTKTPDFILKRKRPDMTRGRVKQRKDRVKELEQLALSLTDTELAQAFDLAMSDVYLRYPFLFLRQIYFNHYIEVTRNLKQKNVVAVYQNLYELLIVLSYRDRADETRKAFEVIRRFMTVHFIFTGGIDQWECKRISDLAFSIITAYNDAELSKEFLELLNVSPVRLAIYTEFNTYPMFNPDPALIGLTSIPEPLYLNHFYEYVVQQLGPTYTWNFDAAFNRNMAIAAVQHIGLHGTELVQDQIMFSLGEDFGFFSVSFGLLCKTLKIDAVTIALIDEILLSYKRCLAVNVQRIMIKYRNLFSKKEEEYEPFSPEHIRFVHAKHEHHLLRRMFDAVLMDLAELYQKAGFVTEGDKLWERFKYVLKEAVELPIPKAVPDGLYGSATPDDFVDEAPPKPGSERRYKIRKDF